MTPEFCSVFYLLPKKRSIKEDSVKYVGSENNIRKIERLMRSFISYL